MVENRAGQPETGRWYAQIVSEEGEERRFSTKGIDFWCAEIQASKTTRTFRDGLESKTYSVILGSTNVSKLISIKDGAQVDYRGNRHKVIASDYDRLSGKYVLALS